MGEKQEKRPSKPWQPRYSIAGILLIMIVFSVMAASASYMVKAVTGGKHVHFIAIIFTFVAPVALMMVVSTIYFFMNRRR